MRKRVNLIQEKIVMTSKEHYTYARRYIQKKYRNRDMYQKVARFIINQIEPALSEELDGVYLDKFGYFFVMMTPKGFPNKIYVNNFISTDGRRPIVVFKTKTTNAFLADYMLDYQAPIQEKIRKRVLKGQRYTFNNRLIYHFRPPLR